MKKIFHIDIKGGSLEVAECPPDFRELAITLKEESTGTSLTGSLTGEQWEDLISLRFQVNVLLPVAVPYNREDIDAEIEKRFAGDPLTPPDTVTVPADVEMPF